MPDCDAMPTPFASPLAARGRDRSVDPIAGDASNTVRGRELRRTFVNFVNFGVRSGTVARRRGTACVAPRTAAG